MWVLGPVGFGAPWVLLGLLALPILWVLLRAVPPAPVRRQFPGVALLLGLKDEDSEAERTPWWLLLLRMLALAVLIVAFAKPVLNPRVERGGSGPLLVLMDASWASGPDWSLRMGRVEQALEQAQAADRTLCLLPATALPPEGCVFLSASDWRARLAEIKPASYAPDMTALCEILAQVDGAFETLWLSDGLERDGRGDVLALLQDKGPVSVFETGVPLYAIAPVVTNDTGVDVPVLRRDASFVAEITLSAHGTDPAGVARILAQQNVVFGVGDARAVAHFDLPTELRNRISRFEIDGQRSAGARWLVDDSLKRREVGLVSARDNREGLQLLSQLHYLRAALRESSDTIEGSLSDLLQANPDVLILADIAHLSEGETASVLEWVTSGGILLRFAGPNLAASDVARERDDPLLPVRLRAGGRTIGGAMSWGEPKLLRPFAETSPFYGLPIPDDVAVSAQVMAQPGPDLSQRVIASLADGTPLVTRKSVGQGAVVLFHVTANAEWSTLPLSGLFISMLDRLAVTSRAAKPDDEALSGQMLQPVRLLDGFGDLRDAGTHMPVEGSIFAAAGASAAVPPGLYQAKEAVLARNVMAPERGLTPVRWPDRVVVSGVETGAERPLTPLFLMLGLALLGIDLIASLLMSGRLALGGAAPLLLSGLLVLQPGGTRAQEIPQDVPLSDEFALSATRDVALAYVRTGDAQVDEVSQAGLRGLSDMLSARTSVEPAAPIGVDLDRDPLGLFPILYWPVLPTQSKPSAEAYARLNAYLRRGGTILFDTRDADLAGVGAVTPAGAALQSLARPLDIPALEEIPEDHVLTRTFYLLREFPGRHATGTLWVEAAPNAERAEGMPFRDLNDNVTPVVIGGGDWAAAWAVDRSGYPLLPVGRGYTGDRQRELAYRFGINLVMYVLTGNYKSDQVHVPALLDRLGQ
nr:DUF4159 domain-containing protein [uncultured Celeribacter sp.]